MKLVCALCAVFVLAYGASGSPPTDDAKQLPRLTEVDGDRVYTLLRPDAIPSIDQPRFVHASEATFMDDDEPVVGVVVDGIARAYSTWFLDHHEIVNDTIAGQPLAVTW